MLTFAFVACAVSPPALALPQYGIGTVPVAAGQGELEFPVAGDFRAEVGFLGLSQGTFVDRNPFAHFSYLSPWTWIDWYAASNLRLSAGFQEIWNLGVSEMGIPSSHEERFMARARLQQPRGETALYQMLQFDVRSFDDPAGNHQVVFRPRLRLGVGLNLDASRINSMALYQEAALRFADSSYTTRAFDFYRAVVGYTWTTRRGLFVNVALVGQASLDPSGANVAFLYGAVLSLAYRIAPPSAAVEVPPEPPQIETP